MRPSACDARMVLHFLLLLQHLAEGISRRRFAVAPRVCVIISVYNGGLYLHETLENTIDQTFTDFEFIIIDDGSTDHTWDLLTAYPDYRIKLFRNPENIGLTRSLNRGLTLAGGTYIARQDGDDVSLPTRLEKQLEYLQTHSNVALLGTAYRLVDNAGRLIDTLAPPGHRRDHPMAHAFRQRLLSHVRDATKIRTSRSRSLL